MATSRTLGPRLRGVNDGRDDTPDETLEHALRL